MLRLPLTLLLLFFSLCTDIMAAFLRRHVELVPLAAVVVAGVAMAAGFIGDVATNGYMLA
jgi:hypothetical protein